MGTEGTAGRRDVTQRDVMLSSSVKESSEKQKWLRKPTNKLYRDQCILWTCAWHPHTATQHSHDLGSLPFANNSSLSVSAHVGVCPCSLISSRCRSHQRRRRRPRCRRRRRCRRRGRRHRATHAASATTGGIKPLPTGSTHLEPGARTDRVPPTHRPTFSTS
jgi:hypothetical protein